MTPGGAEYGPETVVWRRIPPWHFPKRPRVDRPDSPAFADDGPDEPMSVVVARTGRDPVDILAVHDGFGVVSLTVADLRVHDLSLIADPQPDEPDHALVKGPKSKKTMRALSAAAIWVIRPPAAWPPAEP